MKLHNTRTKQASEVVPQDGQAVRIYSCGPTVYDHIHIGNLSSFIFADTLRRTVQTAGYQVKHVMNFTDVDDKTIRRSHERYPDLDAKTALLKLTSEYSDLFLKDMQAVGNDVAAMQFVKATETIEGMQQLIKELYEKKFAYIADDGVYFSIAAYKESGKTYGQLTEITASSTSESRIQNDEYDKESAHDFALWKKQKDDEPAWEFELDGQDITGRPGWHIECSVMSSQSLGQPFDIHTGGVDLIFPHHENEIAQSTAGKDDPIYAQVFAHNEHLLVDGQKMSKSLNNFYTLKDITDKGFDPLAFRLLVLQASYRNQAHFSWENLEAAQNRLNSYRTMADQVWQASENGKLLSQTLTLTKEMIDTALEVDLDTPQALVVLSGLESAIDVGGLNVSAQNDYKEFLDWADRVFGLMLSQRSDITNEQKQLIAERESARLAKDWTKSDELRDQLKEQGVGLNDTARGAIWFRM
jgi:cysteinyl-tRNA synthetase